MPNEHEIEVYLSAKGSGYYARCACMWESPHQRGTVEEAVGVGAAHLRAPDMRSRLLKPRIVPELFE